MRSAEDFDITLWEKRVNEEIASREAKRIETLRLTMDRLKRYFAQKEVEFVLLLGSILREQAFYEFSDIDVAVKGLRNDYFKTLCELEELLGRQVDLIDLDDCRLKGLEKRGVRIT